MEEYSKEKFDQIIARPDIKIVCLDYFDTIVHRKIHEKNIKRLWAARLSEHLLAKGRDISPQQLFEARKKAEGYARKICDFKREATYRAVMQVTEMFLPDQLSGIDFVEEALKCDIEIEIENQSLDIEMASNIVEAKKAGKFIWIISDFYLPKCAFEKFLKVHRISEYVDEIFVSSDLDKRKSDGSIYEDVALKAGNKSEIVMIGDNEKSDYEKPNECGLMAIYKEYYDDQVDYTEHYVKEQLESIIRSNQEPYSNYSLVLYLFVEKLYRTVCREGERKLYFLSREGKYLKKLFDDYLLWKGNSEIETHYLCVSRYALNNVIEDSNQRNNFYKYLKREGIEKSTAKIVLVDVGWKGTMQDMLHALWPATNIVGYYIGTNELALNAHNSEKRGLIFSFYPFKTVAYDCFIYDSFLQEKLLTADHGSVYGYSNEGLPAYENNQSAQMVYMELRKTRDEIECNFKGYMELCGTTGYLIQEFTEYCAEQYVDMMLNKNKEHRIARIKYEAKDKHVYANAQKKKNSIKSQLVWLKLNKASLIAYFRMYEMYCEKVHLNWSIPLLAKIVKLIQTRLLRNEFNWSKKLDEIH